MSGRVAACRGALALKGRLTALLTLALYAGTPTGLPAAERGPVKSLLELRQQGVVIQRWDLSCGAAALATILNFQHGDMVTEREITRGLIRRDDYLERPELVRIRQGFSLLDLKRYVDGRGYVGIGYGKLEVEDLIRLAPVIVPIRTHGYNHFVIFRGTRDGRVLLADPAFGNWTISIRRFETAWLDFPDIGKVGFMVARPGGRVPPNELAARPEQFLAPSAAAVRQALPF
jgi:predicted double-glycine peptidase